jgi:phosphoglycerol transferase MdoB-like AlkP superfamily enzyme
MPRLIEIVLFLTPLITFLAWRLLFPARPPAFLFYGLAAFTVVMVVALLWVWRLDAVDAKRAYVPDVLQNGRVVTHPGSPP